jgi:multidrug resistance protein MdtO
VVYLVFTHIWPVSIAGRIEAALAALVAQWHALIHAPQPAARRQHAAAALALHGAITQDLILAHYEPASVGQAPERADLHRDRLATLDAISGPVFLLAERFPGDPALAQRLDRLHPDGPPLAAAQPGAAIPADAHDDLARQALLAIIDQQLEASHADAPAAPGPNPIHAQT